MPGSSRLRWIAVSVFIVSSTLNYLDRSLLAVLAPMILGTQAFGWIVAAFSITYAIASLAAGWLLDRIGVNRGISWAVGIWSGAAIATAFSRGPVSLGVVRSVLAVGESAGVPAVGKVNGLYLEPSERALGAAVNQIGLSLGASLAAAFVPLAVATSWRVPFIVAGALGLIWIPIWLLMSRAVPHSESIEPQSHHPIWPLLENRNLQILMLANVFWMGAYSVWSNWTTSYLTRVYGITVRQSAAYVWIPPLISNLGGFFGGWLSYRWMSRGSGAISSRRRAVWWSAVGMLSTVLLPFARTPALATAVISASFFFALAGSVNIYALPIDLFGPERAGFAIAALGFAFGLLQTVLSPIVGFLADYRLYTEVAYLIAVPGILAAFALTAVRAEAIPFTGSASTQTPDMQMPPPARS